MTRLKRRFRARGKVFERRAGARRQRERAAFHVERTGEARSRSPTKIRIRRKRSRAAHRARECAFDAGAELERAVFFNRNRAGGIAERRVLRRNERSRGNRHPARERIRSRKRQRSRAGFFERARAGNRIRNGD